MPTSIPLVHAEPSPRAEPLFDRIGIVGLGLIGGSIALAARRLWPKALVIGVDRNDVLEQAMVRHAMDVAADDLGLLREADLVILAAPVEENVLLLDRLGECVTGTAVVSDVGSTKRAIVEAARRLPDRLAFVGGHPLAGAARSGIEFASADLFRGRPWVLTPREGAGGAPLERLTAFVAALGATPRVMDPATHDHLVAFLSHLPQLTVSALMGVIGAEVGEGGLALAGRGLVDTTRLASSPARVWTDICRTNADEIGAALDRLTRVLGELRASLADPAVVARIFGEAEAWRERLTSDRPPRPAPEEPGAGSVV